MDKKLLNKAFREITSRLKKVEVFTLEQSPQIIKEIWLEGLIDTYFSLGVGFLFLVTVGTIWFLFPKETVLSCICGGMSLGCLLWIAVALETLVLIKKCPKLFILRAIKDLLTEED